MAILDIHDLGLARQKGHDIVGVMAFVQRPLAAVLAQPEIRSPKDLEGERVGVTGLPSDDAVLRVDRRGRRRRPGQGAPGHDRLPGGQGAAGRAGRGRDGVLERGGRRAARASGRRCASSASTTTARRAYPELVLCVTRATLEDDAPMCARRSARCSAATARPSAIRRAPWRRCRAAEPRLDEAALAAELDAVDEAFTAGAPRVRRAASRACCARGRAGTSSSGSSSKPPDVDPRVRHVARRARAAALTRT